MSHNSQRSTALRMLVLATAMWGISFSTMKALTMMQQQLVPEAGSWFFASLDVMCRFGFAGLVLVIVSWRSLGRLTRREFSQGAGLAAFGVGGILLQMDGLAHTEASTSAFLTQCYVLLIPLWVSVRHGRRPTFRLLTSCALVMAGAAVLSGMDWRTFRLGRGEAETVLASVMFAGQILWLERPVYAGNNVNHFSCVMFLSMSLLAAPLAAATAPQISDWHRALQSVPVWGCLAVLVIPCTLGSYMMMNRWQPHLTATEAGLIYCIEPVFASVLALFLPGWFSRWGGIGYLNETVTPNLLVGGGLITAANIILQLSSAPAPVQAQRPDSCEVAVGATPPERP